MKKTKGFTLIELMIAILIFAIISVISYRTISALLTTKKIVTDAQEKWGGLAKAISKINNYALRTIPLVVRDENGNLMPSISSKSKLTTNYDAQLEMTISGYIGDNIYGVTTPRRVGFRFINNKLYLINWPVLNRVLSSVPRIDLLLDNVQSFTVQFFYPDMQWHDNWPMVNTSDTNAIPDQAALPKAIKITIKMLSGEEIPIQWVLS